MSGLVATINKNFISGRLTTIILVELAHDKTTSVNANANYVNPFNGNIAGTIWKTSGDEAGNMIYVDYEPADGADLTRQTVQLSTRRPK
jgi:hypothetical protein